MCNQMTQFESHHLPFLAHTNLLQALMNGEVQKPKEARKQGMQRIQKRWSQREGELRFDSTPSLPKTEKSDLQSSFRRECNVC